LLQEHTLLCLIICDIPKSLYLLRHVFLSLIMKLCIQNTLRLQSQYFFDYIFSIFVCFLYECSMPYIASSLLVLNIDGVALSISGFQNFETCTFQLLDSA